MGLFNRRAHRDDSQEAASAPGRAIMVVRRNMTAAYYFFLEKFAKANSIELVQDRRLGDRREGSQPIPSERRNSERRGPLPATWEQGDFVLIRPADDVAQAAERKPDRIE
jgi:hypothetical protein